MKAWVPALSLGALLPLLACSDPSGPNERVGGVVVHMPSSALRVGSSLQLQATVLNQSGASLSGGQVTWASDNTAVATVSASGLATGVGAGTARIRASNGAFSGAIDLQVLPRLCSAAEAPQITMGQARTGAMSGGAACDFYGAVVQAAPWRIQLSARTRLDIRAAAHGYGMDLVVTDPQMTVIAASGGVSLARLLPELEAGSWIVWVVVWDAAPFDYELSVDHAPDTCNPDGLARLAIGDALSGSFLEGQCLFDAHVPARGWRIDLAEQARILARLTGRTPFGGALLLTDTAMNYVADSWSYSDGVQLVRTLPAGSYLLWALSFELDPFELSLAAAEPACAASDTIGVGSVRNARLEAGDCVREDGRFADGWALELPTGASLEIAMSSVEFDTYLILEDSTGLEIAWDDDSGEGLNSLMRVALSAGSYVIRATTYAPGWLGSYQLSVRSAASAAPMAGARRAPGKLLDEVLAPPPTFRTGAGVGVLP